jgi:hypothetical protein
MPLWKFSRAFRFDKNQEKIGNTYKVLIDKKMAATLLAVPNLIRPRLITRF